MRVEVLYFDGCPAYVAATRTLREILAELGVEADVELVAVNSDEETERLQCPGSPTIRVDGRDLFPVPERSVWALGCGTYCTPESMKRDPIREMIRDALARWDLFTGMRGNAPNPVHTNSTVCLRIAILHRPPARLVRDP